MPGRRGAPAVTITRSAPAMASATGTASTAVVKPSNGAEWPMSSATPWARP